MDEKSLPPNLSPSGVSTSSPSRPPRQGSARQRQQERLARREGYQEPRVDDMPPAGPSRVRSRDHAASLEPAFSGLRAAAHRVSQFGIGVQVVLVIIALAALILVFSIVSTYGAGTILPGVSSLGVNLGGLNEVDAASALRSGWTELRLTVRQGERTWQVAPSELGYSIDAAATARQAIRYGRDEGGLGAMIGSTLRGAPIEPVIEFNYDQSRDGLIRLAQQVNVPAENATLRFEGTMVIHIEARNGLRLNIAELIGALAVDPARTVVDGVITLPMNPVEARITNAMPLVDFAQTLVQRPLVVEAYDPVSDQTYQLVTPPQQWGEWLDTRLVSYPTGPRLYLSLSAAQVRSYLEAQAATLPPPLTLDISDGVVAMQESVTTGTLSTWVTVRYLPTVHVVQRGESAYRISREQGIPFYMIQQANPDRDLSELYVGDEINLPSRDLMLPLRPVRGKRIIVDISDQYLWAYENGQIVFEWQVSTGVDEAPTSTGVFQILGHQDLAAGSGFALCDESGSFNCGQWVMHWFMGVYEAVPGLMNGFHGAVELPNGGYLGGGNVGRPYTFGCIMMLDANAEMLYRWAEEGVVVEIRQ